MKKLVSFLLAAVAALGLFSMPAAATPVTVKPGRYTGWSPGLQDYTGNPIFTLNADKTFELEAEMMDGTAYASGTWDVRDSGGKNTVTLYPASRDSGQFGNLFKESYTFELDANGALTVMFDDNAVFYTANEYRIYNTEPSAWAQAAVNGAIAIGLVPEPLRSGYQRPITRGEFCRVAITLYEMKNGIINPGRENFEYYTDASDEYPAKARSIGIMSEVAPGEFSPFSRLTREQAAVVLNNLSPWMELEWGGQAPGYGDAAGISSWANEAVGAVSNAGIMGDTGGNMFAPKGDFTREQAYVTLYKMYEAARAAGGWFFMDESDIY